MGVFKSERRMWTEVTDLEPVALHLAAHFRAKGYEVLQQQTAVGAWDIDITRTGVFRTISGMRTTLSCKENSVCRRRWTKGTGGMAREFINERACASAEKNFHRARRRTGRRHGREVPMAVQIPAVRRGRSGLEMGPASHSPEALGRRPRA